MSGFGAKGSPRAQLVARRDATEPGSEVGAKGRNFKDFMGRLKGDLGSIDLGLSAIRTMQETVQYEVQKDMALPELLRSELLLIGQKYQRFRGLSREAVMEVKVTSQYFVRWLELLRNQASPGSRSAGIARILRRLAERLQPLQARLPRCVAAYEDVQEDIRSLANRTSQLREQSEGKANLVKALAVAGAVIFPAAIIAEEALLAFAAGSAVVGGGDLGKYEELEKFYGGFLSTLRAVTNKLQNEQDKLENVGIALAESAREAAYLEDDLDDETFDLIAEVAEEAANSFRRTEEQCDEYLAASAVYGAQQQLQA